MAMAANGSRIGRRQALPFHDVATCAATVPECSR